MHLISRKDSLSSSKQDKQNANMKRRSKTTKSYTVISFDFSYYIYIGEKNHRNRLNR